MAIRKNLMFMALELMLGPVDKERFPTKLKIESVSLLKNQIFSKVSKC